MVVPAFPTLPGAFYPGMKRGLIYRRPMLTSLAGKRTATPQQAYPRHGFALPINFLRSAYWGSSAGASAYSELETLMAFINTQMTTGGVFTFEDPEDNLAVAQGFGTGDGATVVFQLVRSQGGFAEPVYSATVSSITVGGSAAGPYSVDEAGAVTFDTAPANGDALVWTGTLAFLCRLDEEQTAFEAFLQGVSSVGELTFSSEIYP